MIDRESVRNHHKRYRKGGLIALLRNDAGGSESALTCEQQQQLVDYLQTHLCLTAKQVAHYVQQTWQVTYSESGITQLLHRLGFVYKKPKLIPGKADAERQLAFIQEYAALQAEKKPEDRIYFMDATHPHHNPIAGYGWIKRGKPMKFAATPAGNGSTSMVLSIVMASVSLSVMTIPLTPNQPSGCFNKSRRKTHRLVGFTLFVTTSAITAPS
jgi:transposase